VSTDSWKNGVFGDWNTGTDWSSGVPSSITAANIAGSADFVVTLMASGSAAAVALNAPGAEFYDAGALNLGGVFDLQAGTLALAYGALNGGTLALLGGTFLSTGGILNGVAVDGVLGLTNAESTLFVENGLSLAGTNGSGAGSIALTGAYASLDFVGSQTLASAQIGIGASGTQPGETGASTLDITHAAGATAGATLSLGGSIWIRDQGGQAQIVVGSLSPGLGTPLPDELSNAGTISTSGSGATLTIAGSGTLVNQGTIAVSNGALLTLATAGLQNSGTITVTNGTLGLGGTFSSYLLSGLGNISVSNGLVEIVGQANLGGGTLSLGTGSSITGSLGALGLAGSVFGGTVINAGGGFIFASGTGTLNDVTYVGNLSLLATGAAVTLTGGTEVANGSITVAGNGAELLLQGSETLNNTAISLGAGGQAAVIGTGDAWLASTATTATLGPNVTVQQTSLYAALQAWGFSPYAGIGLTDTLVNQGTITAAFGGATLSIGGYGTFINQGTIAVSGGEALLASAQDFANTGTLTIGTGSSATLGAASAFYGTPPTWSNTGVILVKGGTLTLQGSITTGQLGTVQETGGMVVLAGTLSNTGSIIAIGASAGLADVSLTGTVIGGTITDSSSALVAGNAGTAMLESTTYKGTLALTQAGALLNVRGGLAVVGGQVLISGPGSELDFIGTQTFNGTSVGIGAAGQAASIKVGHDYTSGGASTLTLGSGLSITQTGTLAAIGTTNEAAGDGVLNAGTITANYASGTLTLGGQDFINQGHINVSNGETLAIAGTRFSNTGVVAISNASLSLAGSLTLAGLGQLTLTDAALSVAGTLNLGSGTLAIGQGSSFGRVSVTGTIANGTIADAGGGLAATGSADLSDVTYLGLLDLTRPFAQLSISNGLTVTGATGSGSGNIQITGAEARLTAIGTQTLNNCAITLGSPLAVYGSQTLAVPELAAVAGSMLTIGSAATLTLVGEGGVLGDSGLGDWTDSLVNDGSINASLPGDTLTLGSTNFLNAGTITAQQGGILYIDNAEFQNTGTLAVGQGSVVQTSLYDYFAAPQSNPTVVSNSGTIAMGGGIIHEMNAGGLFPGVPFLNLAAGQIEGTGTLIAPISNAGTIEAKGGMLSVASRLSGTGTLLIAAGATLNLASVVGTGQVVSFASTSGTLMLSQPASFSGLIGNYVAGDIIYLPGQTLGGVAISNGMLALNTAGGLVEISGTTPLAGALEAGHANGGTTIAITPHVAGATGATVLSVNQPGMLFWTTPSGDILTGTTANMNGAESCNWSANSSIDITDLAPSLAKLAVSAGPGVTYLSVTGGPHSCSVTLSGSVGANLFHLAPDGHGGTMITT
jgi:hypothetical protein